MFAYLLLKYLQSFLKVFNFLIDEFTETFELKCRWNAAPVFKFVLEMLKCWNVKCVHLENNQKRNTLILQILNSCLLVVTKLVLMNIA